MLSKCRNFGSSCLKFDKNHTKITKRMYSNTRFFKTSQHWSSLIFHDSFFNIYNLSNSANSAKWPSHHLTTTFLRKPKKILTYFLLKKSTGALKSNCCFFQKTFKMFLNILVHFFNVFNKTFSLKHACEQCWALAPLLAPPRHWR